ncbi:MAG: hypothetical protein GX100_08110 [candidate division WS1 bacterium]|nr:hypothetical protein [candidate division WS1 bacterium]
MSLFLGIDGGGSKCDAVLVDETGMVLGWGTGGSTNYNPPEVIAASFGQALDMACGDHDLQDVTVSTLMTQGGACDWLKERGVSFRHVSAGETVGAFRISQLNHGIVVLAGTGSFVHGRTRDDRRLQVGGLGPTLGDEGSGYDIGLRALRSILRMPRRSGNHTELRTALLKTAGVSSQWELVRMVYGGRMGRAQIAALCPTVVAHAEGGDSMALEVLRGAAGELCGSVSIVLNELGLVGAGYPVIGVGGVIQGVPLYWEILSDMIRHLDPTLTFIVPPVKLVMGAVFEAMARTGLVVTPELRERVAETQKRFPASVVRTVG